MLCAGALRMPPRCVHDPPQVVGLGYLARDFRLHRYGQPLPVRGLLPYGVDLPAREVRAMSLTPNERIARRIIHLGVSNPQADHGMSATTAKERVAKCRNAPWYRRLKAATLAAVRLIGAENACEALQVSRGYLTQWFKEEGLSGQYGTTGRPIEAKEGCLECGKEMDKPGICSAVCREDWIASEGKA